MAERTDTERLDWLGRALAGEWELQIYTNHTRFVLVLDQMAACGGDILSRAIDKAMDAEEPTDG